MLDRIGRTRVSIEGWGHEFPSKFTLMDLLEKGELEMLVVMALGSSRCCIIASLIHFYTTSSMVQLQGSSDSVGEADPGHLSSRWDHLVGSPL